MRRLKQAARPDRRARICTVTGAAPQQRYTRRHVCRLFRITERQLRRWEAHGLIAPAEEYGFSDLRTLQTICDLRRNGVRPARIQKVLAAICERVDTLKNPLVETRVYREGRRLHVQVGGQPMEPFTGQLLFDFNRDEFRKLVALPAAESWKTGSSSDVASLRARVDAVFQRALEAERTGAMDDAIAFYRQAVEWDPGFAGAYVNLGTIYYAGRDFKQAERYYQLAIRADPSYPLAFYNLGNLYDELGDRPKALLQYLSALKLDPSYADAHYNIALLYQAAGQALKAMHHWKTYLKLDPGSPWAAIARRELARVYRETVVPRRDTPESGTGGAGNTV